MVAAEAPARWSQAHPPVRGRRPGRWSLETFQSFCPRLIDAELGPGPGYGGYTDYGEYEVRSEETISTTQWSRGKLVTLHQHGALLLPLRHHRGGQGHSPAGACHHHTL